MLHAEPRDGASGARNLAKQVILLNTNLDQDIANDLLESLL